MEPQEQPQEEEVTQDQLFILKEMHNIGSLIEMIMDRLNDPIRNPSHNKCQSIIKLGEIEVSSFESLKDMESLVIRLADKQKELGIKNLKSPGYIN